ncbi:MAG: hypothetical protein DMG97_13525 [Acidobacteria bacterium]|nr:MAG: hypothetical protein DMG97_13525 [Acidobacteriota bacterium]PYV74186.1 MAG: hypothetical protein DMG96_20910 [Acidobacteriota bacterium]
MALLFPSAQLMQIGNLIQFPGSNFTGFNQDSGLDAFGIHTSGHTIAGDSLCPYDRSDDGGSKPCSGGAPFRQHRSAYSPLPGGVRGTFQRGVFTSEDMVQKLNCRFQCPPRAWQA